MLFDDEDLSGRKLFSGKAKKNTRRKPVLNVKARTSKIGSSGVPKTAVFVLVPVAVIAIGVLLWFICWTTTGWLFSRNDRFTIRYLNIEIDADATISAEKVSEWAQIKEGMNMFSFSINDVRSGILKHAWNIETLEIRRILPDTVRIIVKEREPVARLGRNGVYGIDGNGFVFVLRSRKILPVIEGYRKPGMNVKPGDQLEGMVQAGLEVLEVCDNPEHGVSVRAIDVSGDGHIELHVDGNRSVPLSWSGMGQRTAESRGALETKIRRLGLTTRNEQGKQMSLLKAQYGEWIYGER